MNKSTTILINVIDIGGSRPEKIDSFVKVEIQKIGTVVITDLSAERSDWQLEEVGELSTVLAPTLTYSVEDELSYLSNEGGEKIETRSDLFFLEWSPAASQKTTVIKLFVKKILG